jgi:hypothetical protein
MRVRLVCLLALLTVGGADQAAANWNEPGAGSLNIDSTLSADSPVLATVAGTPFVAWEESAATASHNSQVRVKRLDGAVWTPVGGALNVDTSRNAYEPVIAEVAGVPYDAWAEDNGTGAFQIRVKRLENGSWTSVGGSLNADMTHDAQNPEVASIGGVPYVTWREYNGSRYQIRVARLENGTWTAVGGSLNINATNPGLESRIVDVGGVPYVAWREQEPTAVQVYVKRLENGAWAAVGGSLNANTAHNSGGLAMATVAGAPYVAWTESDGSTDQLMVKRLNNGTWIPVGGGLNTTTTHGAFDPSIVAFGATPMVAWYEYTGSMYEVFAKRYDGSSWALIGPGSLNVVGTLDAQRPNITNVDGVPYVGWDEYDANDVQQIRVKRLEPDIGAESAVPSATGATLAAQVNDFGLPLPIGFEFGTTPAFGTQTVLQSTSGAGASTVTQDITGLTPQTAYSFRAFGSDGARQTSMGATQTFTTLAAGGAPPPLALPVISNLKLTPATFRAAKGTVVTYNDSVAATTTLTVQRPTIGRRKGGKCVKARTRPPRAKRCTRYVKVRSLKHVDVAGGNRLRLKGRGLKPGAYRLRAVARNAAGAGKPATRRFRVKR